MTELLFSARGYISRADFWKGVGVLVVSAIGHCRPDGHLQREKQSDTADGGRLSRLCQLVDLVLHRREARRHAWQIARMGDYCLHTDHRTDMGGAGFGLWSAILVIATGVYAPNDRRVLFVSAQQQQSALCRRRTVSVSIVDSCKPRAWWRALVIGYIGPVPTFGRRALGRNAMDLGSASKSGRVERARGDER